MTECLSIIQISREVPDAEGKPLGVISKNIVVSKKEEIPKIIEEIKVFLEKDLSKELIKNEY